MSRQGRWISLWVVLCMAAAAGCTSQRSLSDTDADTQGVASDDGKTGVKLVQVTDVPLPRDSKIDEQESFIIGGGSRWVGRLVVKVRTDAAETYNYYFNGMPRLGWTRVTAVQGKVSSLTFTNGDRVANLQITGGMGGATVTLFVSNREIEGG
ncbi:MAG: hypothetical protein FJ198_02255 [Gammaproteobacteria bacterium]|nr:hypothetical protein [Gammaproteobacteria bacterium]MBM4209227.1 hypothetical protein [Gammaproteobacteria bacterium]